MTFNLNKVIMILSLSTVLNINALANNSLLDSITEITTNAVNTRVTLVKDINTSKVKNYVGTKYNESKVYTKSLQDSNKTNELTQNTKDKFNTLTSYFKGLNKNNTVLDKTKLLGEDLIKVTKEKYNELTK